ncbi:MAG: AAA family ATPase [bacterium]
MITLLKVRNYKSLENVELTLGPLHVLIGPNNSGKSNFFDVFQFLRELAEIGGQAVHSRGGFSQIVWGGDVKRAISFELHLRIENGSAKEDKLTYYLELGGGPQFFAITKERLTIATGPKGEKTLLLFPVANNNFSVTDLKGNKFELSRSHDRLSFEQFTDEARYGSLARFAKELLSWSIYNFEPSAMRKPNAVKQDFHFQSTGGNFSSVIHSIQSEHAGKFSEIEDLLKRALPEVRHLFTALTKEGQTYLSWEEESMPLRVPVWAMSDGALRLLGQLAALFSPEQPALACFEEPENYIHPALLTVIADVIKYASAENQVLISTHSPYHLDFFSPENLIIVEKKKGQTQFRFVNNKKSLKEALRVLGLGEIWYSGQLGGTP